MQVGNLGVLHKTKLEGNPTTLTFGLLQLLDFTLPGGGVGWGEVR